MSLKLINTLTYRINLVQVVDCTRWMRSFLRPERSKQAMSEEEILDSLDLTSSAKKIVREFTSYVDPMD